MPDDVTPQHREDAEPAHRAAHEATHHEPAHADPRRRGRVARLLDGVGPLPLVAVGLVALLLAGLLGYVTLRDALDTGPGAGPVSGPVSGPASDPESDPEPGPESDPESPEPAPEPPETKRVVHHRGGFAVAVPTVMEVTREGRTLKLTAEDANLVVNVGPGESIPLPRAHSAFLRTLQGGYRDVDLIGTERTLVDDRPAVTTAGRATNSSGVPIRFVVLTVAAGPQTFTIAAYTARDSDPAATLPLVNAVANGFQVLR